MFINSHFNFNLITILNVKLKFNDAYFYVKIHKILIIIISYSRVLNLYQFNYINLYPS